MLLHVTSCYFMQLHVTSCNFISSEWLLINWNHCRSSCLHLGSLHPRIFLWKIGQFEQFKCVHFDSGKKLPKHIPSMLILNQSLHNVVLPRLARKSNFWHKHFWSLFTTSKCAKRIALRISSIKLFGEKMKVLCRRSKHNMKLCIDSKTNVIFTYYIFRKWQNISWFYR